MIKTKICVECKEEFIPNKYRQDVQKLCSNKCAIKYRGRKRRKRVDIACIMCGKIFTVVKSRSDAKLCSRKCQRKYYLSDQNPGRRRKKIICKICKKEFECSNYENRIFCSLKCFGKSIEGVSRKNEKSQISLHCLNCNKVFTVWNYRKDALFCSKNCKNQSNRTSKICQSCGKSFTVPVYLSCRIFCGQECAARGVGKRISMFSKEITQFLDDNKIVYKTERPIKGDNFKYFVDILIDNIVIECFGDYWHCTPDKYGPDYYHSQIKLSAKEIWDRDALRIDRIRNKGFRTMIIWEGKFNQNKNKVQKEILNEICKN